MVKDNANELKTLVSIYYCNCLNSLTQTHNIIHLNTCTVYKQFPCQATTVLEKLTTPDIKKKTVHLRGFSSKVKFFPQPEQQQIPISLSFSIWTCRMFSNLSILLFPFGNLQVVTGWGNPNKGQGRGTVMPTLTVGITIGFFHPFTPPLQSKM